MLKTIINTDKDYLPLILRITLGLIIIPYGFTLSMNYYETLEWLTGDSVRLPLAIAYAVIIVEFYASLFLILGLASRLMAAALSLITIIAIPYHFFSTIATDWMGQAVGGGIEFHLLIIALTFALIIKGSGRFSLDGALSKLKF